MPPPVGVAPDWPMIPLIVVLFANERYAESSHSSISSWPHLPLAKEQDNAYDSSFCSSRRIPRNFCKSANP